MKINRRMKTKWMRQNGRINERRKRRKGGK